MKDFRIFYYTVVDSTIFFFLKSSVYPLENGMRPDPSTHSGPEHLKFLSTKMDYYQNILYELNRISIFQ